MAEPAPSLPQPKSLLFRVLWGFDLLVAAVVVFFFFWGLADGTVSSFNAGIWTLTLAIVTAVVIGGAALQRGGYRTIATLLLLVLALPGLAFTLFLLAVLIFQPRWN